MSKQPTNIKQGKSFSDNKQQTIHQLKSRLL